MYHRKFSFKLSNLRNIFFTLLSQKPAEKTKLMTSLNVFLIIYIITPWNFFYMYRRTELVPTISKIWRIIKLQCCKIKPYKRMIKSRCIFYFLISRIQKQNIFLLIHVRGIQTYFELLTLAVSKRRKMVIWLIIQTMQNSVFTTVSQKVCFLHVFPYMHDRTPYIFVCILTLSLTAVGV